MWIVCRKILVKLFSFLPLKATLICQLIFQCTVKKINLTIKKNDCVRVLDTKGRGSVEQNAQERGGGVESVNLSPRYDKVTCLTHGNGVRRRGGWGVGRRG